ncbi:MAG: hypothetical protein ACPH5P_00195 [Akkermansiaceae bacterium]
MNIKHSKLKAPWEEECSPWKNESEFWTWVRGQMRLCLWSRNPIKNAAKRAAAKPAPKGHRAKKVIQCCMCNDWLAQSKIEVDHIKPAGSLRSFDDIAPFARELLWPSEGVRMVCKPCHKIITYADRQKISVEEARAVKKAIAIMKLKKPQQIMWMKSEGIYTEKNSINSVKRRAAITDHLKKKK